MCINALHVLPAFQGHGIGTKLLQTALDWFGKDEKIFLEVVTYNDKAKAIYKKYGFKEEEGTLGDQIILSDGRTIPKFLMVRK